MNIIGISGKSGAGKTTLSNFFAKELDAEVFHLDDIQRANRYWKNRIKENRLFKGLVSTENDGSIQVKQNAWDNRLLSTVMNILNKASSSWIRKRLLEKVLDQAIKNGKTTLILEGVELGNILPEDLMLHIVEVQKSYHKRVKDINGREKRIVSRENIIRRDKKYRDVSSRLHYDSKIENNGTIDEFYEKARQVMETIKQKTRENQMSQRYGVDRTPRLVERQRGREPMGNHDRYR